MSPGRMTSAASPNAAMAMRSHSALSGPYSSPSREAVSGSPTGIASTSVRWASVSDDTGERSSCPTAVFAASVETLDTNV